MARTTKQLSGGGKDKFLLGVVASVDGVTPAVADRIGAALADGIAEVRVRRDVWDAQRSAPASRPMAATAPVAATAKPTTAIETAPAFDPFAFSAVALLTKKGKAALAAALDKIDTVDNLRRLAEAQHLALDPAVSDMAAIRTAIIAATERRIAERKAAAS